MDALADVEVDVAVRCAVGSAGPGARDAAPVPERGRAAADERGGDELDRLGRAEMRRDRRRRRGRARSSAGRRCRWRARRRRRRRRRPTTRSALERSISCLRSSGAGECRARAGARGRIAARSTALHCALSDHACPRLADAALPVPDRHHRRGLPLREHLGPRHPRARRGDREGGLRGAGHDQLRRPLAVRAAAEPRQRLHPVDRRRGVHRRPRARPGGAQPAQVHQRGALQERRGADLPLRRDAHLAAPAERHPARAARLHPHVRGHAGVRRPAHHPRGAGATSTASRRRSSRRWSTTRRTARTRGTARATRAASPS